VSPQARREAVTAIWAKTGISERRACALIGLSRTVLHYERRTCGRREALRGRVVSLAAQRRRFGYRRIHALLRREGEHVNVKCVHRLYREERLQVQRRRRRKGVAFSKEAVDIVVDHGISGQYVTRVLDAIARFRSLPQTLRTDQGPEFTGRALDQWAYERGIELRLIEAGKPTQNAYVESFNGKFGDECLNEQWFGSLAVARAIVATWRIDYNE